MRNVWAASILAFLAPVLPACAQTSPSTSAPVHQKNRGSISGPARVRAAPDFTLESLDGETVRLADFRGKVVVLNFWATWCAPCKILTPSLVELQSEYGPQGLRTIGITLDDDATKVEISEFADKLRVNYPLLIGNEKVAEAYGGLPALPETFFIARDSKIVDSIIGLKGKAEIEGMIKKALNTQAVNSQSAASQPPQH
jgi:thiol-disulfide isomerase/thioredoxin